MVGVGGLLFLSGQIGIGPHGRVVSDDPEDQIAQAYVNVKTLLSSAGATMRDVVRITSYLTDAAHKPALQRIRRTMFSPPYPASTLLIVKALASPDYLYEVDVVAVARNGAL
jgi:2-iminobutanoate/2-iminopropanoate deaminase